MNKFLKIEIAKPCAENWDKMTNVEQGKFCSSCNKIVIDFSTKSSAEIINFFENKNDRVCGRFTTIQLNQVNYYLAIPKTNNWLKYMGVLAIGAMVFTSNASAQKIVGKPAVSVQYQTSPGNKKQPKTNIIYGYVFNKNKPVSRAKVYIDGIAKPAITNAMGRYEFLLPLDINYEANNFLSCTKDDFSALIPVKFSSSKQENLKLIKIQHYVMGEPAMMPVKQPLRN